jgi:phosphoribosyl-dephospho-CoA transferase
MLNGMDTLARNQLVWLHPKAWEQLRANAWDAEAQALLAHWHTAHLPLVVCRQRTDVHPDQISLGLPAPLQWSRRRLALTVHHDQVASVGKFPTLRQVAQNQTWRDTAHVLDSALKRLGTTARVYGSHGWQWLTGLHYVHDASDIDVMVEVSDLPTGASAVALLSQLEPQPRFDGEIVFPGDCAVAWRELQRVLAGQTAQVLVKARKDIRLVGLDGLQAIGRSQFFCGEEVAG